MIFQDPMTSLNPVYTVGWQLAETIKLHNDLTKKECLQRAEEMLRQVGIPSPRERLASYPHELSGGMRQRVMIAMAVVNSPKVLIADEPTTALDVTTQAQILELIRGLRADHGSAIVFITHDLGVVAELCDEVAVMYAGRVVERASVDEIFSNPQHPYTWGLLGSLPARNLDNERLFSIPGSPPSLLRPPPGCRFAPRCDHRMTVCTVDPPPPLETTATHAHAGRLSPGPGHEEPRCRRGERHASGGGAMTGDVLLRVTDLRKHFPVREGLIFRRETGALKAVDGVSFEIRQGETLGLVGESGCGKSTVARCVVRLLDATSGRIEFQGEDITDSKGSAMRRLRRDLMMIFQDPLSSLNPRMRVGQIVSEPLDIHTNQTNKARASRVNELLEMVGLSAEHANRFPHEFSGGQRQRIGIARALALEPKLIVCDEPVSALDVSVQAQILNLLEDLQREFDLTYLFIAHDLDVVRRVSDHVQVMYLGQVVEEGPAADLYARPIHPYTAALLSARPEASPAAARAKSRILLEGDVPSPLDPPDGCRFHSRCPRAQSVCAVTDPDPTEVGAGRRFRCHYPIDRWPIGDIADVDTSARSQGTS